MQSRYKGIKRNVRSSPVEVSMLRVSASSAWLAVYLRSAEASARHAVGVPFLLTRQEIPPKTGVSPSFPVPPQTWQMSFSASHIPPRL